MPHADHRTDPPSGWWRRFVATLPLRGALVAVGAVWLLGCIWSFQEQSAFAASRGFTFPHLLPLVIDGFAVSMAGVSWAASLDARPAVSARLATVVAVGASSASNGLWAWVRSSHDTVAVVLGVAVPVAADLAFEVLLAELRRQVQRRRGLAPPIVVPFPRVIRLVLSPSTTFRQWRTLVLAVTELQPSVPTTARIAVHKASDSLTAPALPGDPTVPEPPKPLVAKAAQRPKSPQASPDELAGPCATGSSGPPPEPLSRTGQVELTAEEAEKLDVPVTDDAEAADQATDAKPSSTGSGHRTDERVSALVGHLLQHARPHAVTGDQVGQLLGRDINPRTGRRLLAKARERLPSQQDHHRTRARHEQLSTTSR